MIKNIRNLITTSFFIIACQLGAIEYDIQDIGTLQTKESHGIAINNQGQILGWYNIDGTPIGKRFFIRNRDGAFHELPINEKGQGWVIDWRYLTNDGKVYGVFDGNAQHSVLYRWDNTNNDVVKPGNLPGKEIVKINNKGQVLIKSVVDIENGKHIRRPAIWENGRITKLPGLEGNVGIESEESYGLDMNNNGEVVGQSKVFLSYKNALYTQTHAVKWINGQAIDLHRSIPKSESTCATAINDLGDVIISSYLIRADGERRQYHLYSEAKATDTKYFLQRSRAFLDREGNPNYLGGDKIFNDHDCIWMYPTETIDMNDDGEIIAQGRTIYGEEHIMLFVPIKSQSK